MADYTYTGTVAWDVQEPGPVEIWFAILRDFALPVYDISVASTYAPDLWFDVYVDTPILFNLFSGADVEYSLTSVDNRYVGEVAVDFTAGAEVYWDRIIEGSAAAWYAAGADITDDVDNIYVYESGAAFLVSLESDKFIDIGEIFETGTAVWGCHGGVSTLHLDIDPPPALLSFVTGAEVEREYAHSSELYTGDAAVKFDVADGVTAVAVGTVQIEGSVAVDFSVDTTQDRSPAVSVEAFVVALHEAESRQPQAISEFFPSVASVYSLNQEDYTYEGTVAMEAMVDHDRVIGIVYERSDALFSAVATSDRVKNSAAFHVPTVVATVFFGSTYDDVFDIAYDPLPVFIVEPAAVTTYGYTEPVVTTPVDTTWILGAIQGRGPSAAGAYTETDQDGAWTENVGYAMSQGGERGAYTQDDAYILEVKPNVFPTTKAVPTSTVTDDDEPSATDSSDSKPTTTPTDDDAPVSE